MSDAHVAMVRALEAGATYRQAAEPHNMNRVSAWRAWQIYKRKGIEAVQAIAVSPMVGRHVPYDADYDLKWIAAVKAKCIISDAGCWLWQGNLTTKGYGSWLYRGKPGGIHRNMYRLHHGLTLKTEQFVLHRCDIRNCCNPDHLFLGTAKVNNWDCALKKRHHFGVKTECPQGHPYDEENTYWTPSKSGGLARHCKACHRIRCRQRWQQKRQAARQSA